MNILIDGPPNRTERINVAFADVARIPDDFTPVEDLTREQIIDVVYAFSEAFRKAGERRREHDAFVFEKLGHIADTLRGRR